MQVDLGPAVAVPLKRHDVTARVLFARHTPAGITGQEVAGLDLLLVFGRAARWPWWLLRPLLSLRAVDREVPDPSGDGVCHSRQVRGGSLIQSLRGWGVPMSYVHALHPLGQRPELLPVGALVRIELTTCALFDKLTGGRLNDAEADLGGYQCPHVIFGSVERL